MTDASQIDDRRRFKELWKELLVARLLAGAIAGAVLFLALIATGAVIGLIPLSWVTNRTAASVVIHLVIAFMTGFFLAAPSAVSRQGRATLAVVGCAAAVAHLLVLLGCWLLGEQATGYALFGAVGAAIGVSEGVTERSIATAHCGLLGGSASGLVLNWTLCALPASAPLSAMGVGRLMIMISLLHLGIGLSLALGRWIRDLPKRKQEQTEPTQ